MLISLLWILHKTPEKWFWATRLRRRFQIGVAGGLQRVAVSPNNTHTHRSNWRVSQRDDLIQQTGELKSYMYTTKTSACTSLHLVWSMTKKNKEQKKQTYKRETTPVPKCELAADLQRSRCEGNSTKTYDQARRRKTNKRTKAIEHERREGEGEKKVK